MSPVSVSPLSPPGWRAELELRFRRQAQRTVIAERRHLGPLRVQRPFYPESSACCHVYLLHPPGGIVGGDGLQISLSLEDSTQVLVTTPAATKFYRNNGSTAKVDQHFDVAQAATLEWLPQETIVFDRAWAANTTQVELADNAGFIGWEILCLGRPAAKEAFCDGLFTQRWQLQRRGRPLFHERLHLSGNGEAQLAAWGLAGHRVSATLIACISDAPAESLLAAVRQAMGAVAGDNILCSASQMQEVIVCRTLGDSAEQARRTSQAAWQVLRQALWSRTAVVPRIWNT